MKTEDIVRGDMESSHGSREGVSPNTKTHLKNVAKWLGGILGLLLAGGLVMAILGVCPPSALRLQTPWCPAPSTDAAAVDGLQDTPGREGESLARLREEAVTESAELVFGRLTCTQSYFDNAVLGLGLYVPNFTGEESPTSVARFSGDGYLDCIRFLECAGPYSLPDEYLEPLADDGVFLMPTGVCESDIISQMNFIDQSGEAITGERILDEEVLTIDMTTLTSQALGSEDLEDLLVKALQPGDMRLTTTDGWTEVLWEPLVALQQPMDSFIEYHLWNNEEELEGLVSEWMQERMQIMDIPEIVIEVFQESDGAGWYASDPAQPENAVASADTVVEFIGDAAGVMQAQRPLAFSTLGEIPVLGPITGSGTLHFRHPTLGILYFEVDFTWSSWDRMGRVISGDMRMVEQNSGYEVRLTFKPDGTKQGRLYADDALVGRVDMVRLADIVSMKPYPLD